MNKLYYVGALLLCSGVIAAEEAVAPVIPPLPEGAPAWVTYVWPILFVVVLPFVVNMIRSKRKAADAEAAKIELDANLSLMEQKNLLIDKRVIPFLWATAEHMAANRLPLVLKDAMDGDGKFDWKGHASAMKDDLLDLTKDKFAAEGIDIVKVLGEKYLGSLIDRAIAKAIPWLPVAFEPAATNLAEGKGKLIAGLVIDKGLNVVNSRWLNNKLDLNAANGEG